MLVQLFAVLSAFALACSLPWLVPAVVRGFVARREAGVVSSSVSVCEAEGCDAPANSNSPYHYWLCSGHDFAAVVGDGYCPDCGHVGECHVDCSSNWVALCQVCDSGREIVAFDRCQPCLQIDYCHECDTVCDRNHSVPVPSAATCSWCGRIADTACCEI